MNKEFIPYEQALALKELGFDEPCLYYYTTGVNELFEECEIALCEFEYYNGDRKNSDEQHYTPSKRITAPLYQQAFRWFREVHGIDSMLEPNTGKKEGWYFYVITYGDSGNLGLNYKTYEEAELDCLNKLIEIVKNR